MIPFATKTSIFQSIPKTLTIDGTTYTVFVDYADRINVSDLLKNYNLVVTLRGFADRKDVRASPLNQVFEAAIINGIDTKYTKGERAQVTLSINVHANSTTTRTAADIVDAYLSSLMTWYLRDLPEIITVLGRSDISDLSYLSDDKIVRKQLDILLAYSIIYTETSTTIETIVTPAVQDAS